MANEFTLEGTLKDIKNVAIVGAYITIEVESVGSDIEDNVTYPRGYVRDIGPTDSNGDLPSTTVWINGDSGVSCVYRITLPNKQIVRAVVPTAAEGTTVRLEDIVELYQVTGSTQQNTTLDDSKVYTDVLAASPSSNLSFSASSWRTDLGLVIGTNVQAYDSDLASIAAITPTDGVFLVGNGSTFVSESGATARTSLGLAIGTNVQAWNDNLDDLAALTPTNSNIIVGNGTGWVNASNFRVDAGTLGSGTEMGTGTANGIYSVAEGSGTIASGSYSHAEGQSTTASQSTAHAEGESTVASGAASHAEGFFTEASGLASHAEGTFTTASGDYSSATGRRGKAIHQGARVETDSQNADVSSTTTDQFTARFQNGYEFKGGLAAFEGGASFGDANAQATTRANLGVAGDTSGGNVVYVNGKTDFPAAVTGVITLEAGKTYIINTDVDLLGDRILCPASNITMLGRSSETSSLTSSTLNVLLPLITATRTLALRDFTVKDVGTAFDINGLGGTNVALDWRGFNISNVPTIGTIQNIDNHIWQICAILDSGGLTYTNGVNTIAFSDSIISAKSGTTAVTLDSNILLGRRFRVIYSAVIAGDPTSTAFDVDALAAVPTEGYILDTVNFAGGGTYLAGKSVTDNEALFVNCVGIPNSREISNYYMNGNATVTTITTQNVEVKVAGTTTSNTLTQKFTNTDNRATYIGAISRFFKATVTLSVESGNNQQIGVYLAKNGTIIPSTEVYGTTSGNGRAENIVVQGLFELQSNDYIEVFVENSTATNDITVTDLNLIIQ